MRSYKLQCKNFDPKTKIKYELIILQLTDRQTNRFLADSYISSTFQLGDNDLDLGHTQGGDHAE